MFHLSEEDTAEDAAPRERTGGGKNNETRVCMLDRVPRNESFRPLSLSRERDRGNLPRSFDDHLSSPAGHESLAREVRGTETNP